MIAKDTWTKSIASANQLVFSVLALIILTEKARMKYYTQGKFTEYSISQA